MAQFTATAAMPARGESAHDPAMVVRHLALELRQPLGTIESITHYLNMVLPRTEAKARRQLGKLEAEIRQIHWILEDAIHFLQAAPISPHLLDLTEVVSKNLSEWSPEDGAGVALQLEPDLPLVFLDLEQVQHLLRNVVAFFQRISTPGRSITVETYRTPGEVVLSVKSDTLVYSAEELEPLFEPFESRLPTGAGLALASARAIAEAHGAAVDATADPPHSLKLRIAFPAA